MTGLSLLTASGGSLLAKTAPSGEALRPSPVRSPEGEEVWYLSWVGGRGAERGDVYPQVLSEAAGDRCPKTWRTASGLKLQGLSFRVFLRNISRTVNLAHETGGS